LLNHQFELFQALYRCEEFKLSTPDFFVERRVFIDHRGKGAQVSGVDGADNGRSFPGVFF